MSDEKNSIEQDVQVLLDFILAATSSTFRQRNAARDALRRLEKKARGGVEVSRPDEDRTTFHHLV